MTTVIAAHEDNSGEPSSTEQSPAADAPGASAHIRESSDNGASKTKQAIEQQTKGSITADSAELDTAVLPQVLKIVGAVVAPTTLLTALMIYFGQQEAAGFSWYLGVQVTALDLTTQDYLINSADGIIPPLIAVAGTGLVALWGHQLLVIAVPAEIRRTVLRVLLPSAAVTGLLLVSLTVPLFPAFPEARGLGLSLGVGLFTYATRLLRLRIAERRPEQVSSLRSVGATTAEWGAVFILVSVGLFWAVGSYAIGVGVGRAQQLETLLPSYPNVAVYSEKRLNLQGPGVQELICRYPDIGYRFHYEGLKLVRQSGNQYLFLPAGWTHANGASILIPRDNVLRLEFHVAGHTQNTNC
jgi:hypothetical protein